MVDQSCPSVCKNMDYITDFRCDRTKTLCNSPSGNITCIEKEGFFLSLRPV